MGKLNTFFLLNTILLVLLSVTVFSQNKQDVLIRNATVMTAINGTKQNTDILVRKGKIARIGKNIKVGNAKVIDATGKFLTPGIIDAHAHSMLDSINEGTYAVTSMARIRDVLNPKSISVYRALAGGVTSANLLHGSANPIGGQNAVVKFKFGRPVEDFLIPDAPPGI